MPFFFLFFFLYRHNLWKGTFSSVFKAVFSFNWHHSLVSTEVLLDMRATGGELGWLTWPLDQGERSGVSIAQASPPAPTFHRGIRLRVNLRGGNVREWYGCRASGAKPLTTPLAKFASDWPLRVHMSVFFVKSGTWGALESECERACRDPIRSCLQSVSGPHQKRGQIE